MISTKPISLRWKALAVSAALSFLFVAVYGWCNSITAHRPDVGTLYFEWEHLIPFVPLMIIPYLSIDLFFVTAPFFCDDDRELKTFSKRIVFAILVAGLCFLFFPLRFAFARPQTGGWLGALFDWFREMDQPHNLVPSLHVALQVILAQHFARHAVGFWRTVSNVWFVLIGLSTLFTWQHHFIDVVAGFALGVCCLYFIREPTAPVPVSRNWRVSLTYAIASLFFAGLAFELWPWGVILLWPAFSLAITAAGYFGLGPAIFRKTEGRLPWSTRLVLAPVLLGQQISLCYYGRQCATWNAITPKIWIGRTLRYGEADSAIRLGVTAVLDLTAEFSEAVPFRSLIYRNIPILDLTAPSIEQLREMASFIEEESRRGIVYVHCKIGYSRATAAAAAYLLASGSAGSVTQAIAAVRQVRPAIVVRPEVVSVLGGYSYELTRLAGEIA